MSSTTTTTTSTTVTSTTGPTSSGTTASLSSSIAPSLSLREQEAATNRSKEEALRAYDEALRVQKHPDAGSAVGDHLTEAAYAASHRIQEAAHKVQDAVTAAVSSHPTTTSASSETK